jgi:hypothetical protein
MRLHSKLIAVSFITLALSVEHAESTQQINMVSADSCPKSVPWNDFLNALSAKIDTGRGFLEFKLPELKGQISNNSFSILSNIQKEVLAKNIHVKEIGFSRIDRNRCIYFAVEKTGGWISNVSFGLSFAPTAVIAQAPEQVKMVSADNCPVSLDGSTFVTAFMTKTDTDHEFYELKIDGKTAQISKNSSAYLSEIIKEAEAKKTPIKELRFGGIDRNRCVYVAVGENGNVMIPSVGGHGFVGFSFK